MINAASLMGACKLLIANARRDLESLGFLEQCETVLRHAIRRDVYKSTIAEGMDIDHDSNCTCTSSSSVCTWLARDFNGASTERSLFFFERGSASRCPCTCAREKQPNYGLDADRFLDDVLPAASRLQNPPLSLRLGPQSSYFLFYARGARAINYAAADRQP